MNKYVCKVFRKCVHCSINQIKRHENQPKHFTWHRLRRLQVVAIDVMEISTASGSGESKVAVMGDFSTGMYGNGLLSMRRRRQ